jgi:hypothetical protein
VKAGWPQPLATQVRPGGTDDVWLKTLLMLAIELLSVDVAIDYSPKVTRKESLSLLNGSITFQDCL